MAKTKCIFFFVAWRMQNCTLLKVHSVGSMQSQWHPSSCGTFLYISRMPSQPSKPSLHIAILDPPSSGSSRSSVYGSTFQQMKCYPDVIGLKMMGFVLHVISYGVDWKTIEPEFATSDIYQTLPCAQCTSTAEGKIDRTWMKKGEGFAVHPSLVILLLLTSEYFFTIQLSINEETLYILIFNIYKFYTI